MRRNRHPFQRPPVTRFSVVLAGRASPVSAWTAWRVHRSSVDCGIVATVPKRDELAFVRDAFALEAEEAIEAGSLGFYGRVFCQCSLPYQDPGDLALWSRQAGRLSLTVQPAVVANPDGGGVVTRYPYGSLPRLLLIWLTTETVRTKDRRIILGESTSAFMRRIGLHVTGGRRGDIGRLRAQMERLFLSTIVCRYDDPAEGRAAASRYDVADSYQLWWDARGTHPGQGALLPSYVDLSERFFEEVLAHPVPVDLRAIELLRGSPLRLDIYVWLTYRMSYLRRRTAIPWEMLRYQFGSDRANDRQGRWRFRKDFETHLARVLVVYRDARVEATDAGLVLMPSRPHVAARVRRELL